MDERDKATRIALGALREAIPADVLIDVGRGEDIYHKKARELLQVSGKNTTIMLQSVVNRIADSSKRTAQSYWPLVSQALTEAQMFPQTELLSDKEASAAKKKLWEEFKEDYQRYTSFASGDEASLLELLLGLMARYTWSMPASSGVDISLYDESRISAALAACLSSYAETAVQSLKPNSDTPIATFLEGDISGVQRFIYTVPSRGAAKQLRARSLYLQMLTEAAARHILAESHVPITNLIYAGGGHFYVLLPAGIDVVPLQKTMDRLLLTHHDGELYIALGAVSLKASDFAPDAFGDVWKNVKQKTAAAKQRRYNELDTSELVTLFQPRPMTDEAGARYQDRDEKPDADGTLSSLGQSFAELGGHLTRATNIALEFIPPLLESAASGYEAALAAFGMRLYLLDESGNILNDAPRPQERVVVMGLKQYPSERILKRLAEFRWQVALAPRLRYTVNEVAAKNERRVAEFSDLSQASEGINRLGILRMDVDDLGKLFKAGFIDNGKSQASLMRIASLSSALSLFFEGWVGELCRQFNQTYQERITDEEGHDALVEAVYAVYSGGDDLFIVGRWDILPELAQRIRADLDAYSGRNPSVHISAGITLHPGKYPLYQAAEDAGEALDAAKTREGKDAINFLGLTVAWSDWPSVIKLKEDLVSLSQEKSIGRSLLQTLLEFYREYADTQRKHAQGDQVVWGPWLWRTAYQLARLVERAKDHKNALKPLQETLSVKTGAQAIIRIGLAARWADIQTRSSHQEEK